MHKEGLGRPALVMDLIEQFRRPAVDRVVAKMMSNMKKSNKFVEDARLTPIVGRR